MRGGAAQVERMTFCTASKCDCDCVYKCSLKIAVMQLHPPLLPPLRSYTCLLIFMSSPIYPASLCVFVSAARPSPMTVRYQAPETHRKSTSKITQAADVYSFVKIAVEMLSIAETAMERSLILCKTEALLREGRALARVPEGGAKEELRRLLIAGLSANPVDRPSLSQLRSVINALPL
mmetsp:Transcript_26017/g.66062  ORF Transcript_26017/g.66062 Transcript_26017/m.66062 type:complete len:178 (-) Transcript_26017:455-988(-)